ncbi:ABC transporter permease [Pseudomarimonas arenosa]|uniref:ABC transporter permease n=1 Tax=Pseudomarimonas arenosa TaxID=2774145 RepID=A0AAW3ZMJ2_9GAMM|nr:ABC transporter permease [Pseudomarimonas arenosa]
MLEDLRFALRSLWRAPSFSALAITVLALGIGASVAMFGAVNALLLNSVPYPAADRLVMVSDIGPDGAESPMAFGSFREIAARSQSLAAAAVMRDWSPALVGSFEPEQLQGQRVSAEYFHALGVSPLLGSGFDAAADRPGGRKLVVVSDALWQRRFAADPGLIGAEIDLDGQGHRVVGIMPAGFKDVLAPGSEVWTLLQYDSALPADGREWGKHLRMVARLQPHASESSFGTELLQIGAEPDPAFVRPSHATLEHLLVGRLQEQLTRSVKPGVLAAFGAVLLLLLIACVNVANLLLVRGSQRSREFQARAALGASPARLIRQQLVEVLSLAVLGGALGAALAQVALGLLGAYTPFEISAGAEFTVDLQVLVFAFATSISVGLLVGLWPAFRVARLAGRGGLLPVGQRVVGHQRRARNSLVVVEVALAVVLLVSAGLLMFSLNRLFAIDAGFNPNGLLSLQLNASGARYADDATVERFYVDALRVARQVAGVESAAYTNQLPMSEDLDQFGTLFESLADDAAPAQYNTLRYAVSPGYFDTMGIPTVLGRGLSREDSIESPPSVVISQSLARKRFGAANPIGQRLRIGGDPNTPWFTVVGVVADVKQASLTASQVDAVYVSSAQWHYADRVRSLVVRHRGDQQDIATRMRQAIWSVDAQLPIGRVASLDQLLADTAKERRFASVIFAAFGLAALMLAAMGIYSALSVNVAERGNEIGLRVALGARASVIVRWVLTQAMALVGLGILFGLLLASASTRALESLLFGISATDPTIFVLSAALLGLIGLLACIAPLCRALTVDPAQALRWE